MDCKSKARFLLYEECISHLNLIIRQYQGKGMEVVYNTYG